VRGERRIAGLLCSQVLEALGDYLDGSSSDEERTAVESHVAACPDCARFGGAYAAVVEAIRDSRSGDLPDQVRVALSGRLRKL